MELRKLNLDSLLEGISDISPGVGIYLAEAALVCLTANGHQSGVHLKVSGDVEATFELIWSTALNRQINRSWRDLKEAAEYGATALAFLVLQEMFDAPIISRLQQTDGADYVVTEEDDNQREVAVSLLEVSGILKEAKGNTVNLRIHSKRKKRKGAPPSNLPFLIMVAEFGVPKAKMIIL